MHDCDYCEASFESEDEYISHLASEHEADLGPIDRRKVGDGDGGGGDGLPTGPIVLGGVIFASLALVVYVLVVFGGGGSESVHEHGIIEIVIAGERIDLSQARYQVQAERFHLERGNGRIWHTHEQAVALEDALATLDVEVTESVVVFQGTTYRDDDPNTNVSVTVNGARVTPSEYVLEGVEDEQQAEKGDHVRVLVNTTG